MIRTIDESPQDAQELDAASRLAYWEQVVAGDPDAERAEGGSSGTAGRTGGVAMNWSLSAVRWFRRWLRRWLPRVRERKRWRLSFPAAVVPLTDDTATVYPMVVLVAPRGQRWEGGARLPVWLRSRAEPCSN
jgi:hypothetical protein